MDSEIYFFANLGSDPASDTDFDPSASLQIILFFDHGAKDEVSIDETVDAECMVQGIVLYRIKDNPGATYLVKIQRKFDTLVRFDSADVPSQLILVKYKLTLNREREENLSRYYFDKIEEQTIHKKFCNIDEVSADVSRFVNQTK
jgi:hypothetical protein